MKANIKNKSMEERKPKIGIIPGDPSGIGPELIAKLLCDEEVVSQHNVLLVGDRHVFELGQNHTGKSYDLVPVDPWEDDWTQTPTYPFFENTTIEPEEIKIAEVTLASGISAMANLNLGLDLLREKVIEALVFAPFNKEALKLGGLKFQDELHHMKDYLNYDGYITELNTLDGFWTSRVTSHIALKEVSNAITETRIINSIELIDRTLKRSGVKRPRIAVAALNPHAGDGGNFGTEEIDVISPSVKKAGRKQIAVDGPWPSDTVFLKYTRGEVDAIVTMYHDQGQIALKLMGFDRGVTVLGGIPYPITTAAHGTAFDIAGEGIADLGAFRNAFLLAGTMVKNWDQVNG